MVYQCTAAAGATPVEDVVGRHAPPSPIPRWLVGELSYVKSSALCLPSKSIWDFYYITVSLLYSWGVLGDVVGFRLWELENDDGFVMNFCRTFLGQWFWWNQISCIDYTVLVHWTKHNFLLACSDMQVFPFSSSSIKFHQLYPLSLSL